MKQHLQTVCIVLVAIGIIVEFIYTANLGFLMITSGSLAFAVSTKIENRVRKKRVDKVDED